jgi:hypothetical protein
MDAIWEIAIIVGATLGFCILFFVVTEIIDRLPSSWKLFLRDMLDDMREFFRADKKGSMDGDTAWNSNDPEDHYNRPS